MAGYLRGIQPRRKSPLSPCDNPGERGNLPRLIFAGVAYAVGGISAGEVLFQHLPSLVFADWLTLVSRASQPLQDGIGIE